MQDLRGQKKLINPTPLKIQFSEVLDFFMSSQASGVFSLNLKIFLPAVLAILAIIMCISFVYAEEYSDEQIVNAIYRAEGGTKAQFAYGIRSVPYGDITEARRICFNTIRNNRKRFAKQTKYRDFLSFLASRYCPINCDNDRGTNKYWLKNVKFFLRR